MVKSFGICLPQVLSFIERRNWPYFTSHNDHFSTIKLSGSSSSSMALCWLLIPNLVQLQKFIKITEINTTWYFPLMLTRSWNMLFLVANMDYSYKDKPNSRLTSMPLFCDHSSQRALCKWRIQQEDYKGKLLFIQSQEHNNYKGTQHNYNN